MSNPPTKVVLTGNSENLNAGFTIVNTIIDSLLSGDGTAGRSLRVSRLTIEKSVTASELECTLASVFNGDTVAEETGLKKTVSTTSFSLDTTGSQFHIKAGAITGSATHVLTATIIENGTDYITYCTPSVVSSGITLTFKVLNESTAQDLSVGVAADKLILDIIYLTA